MKTKNSNKIISTTNFAALIAVYLMPVVATLMVQKFAMMTEGFASIMNTISSVIQAPLMLVILVQLTDNKRFNRVMGVTLAGLLTSNSIALAFKGVNESNLINIMLVGSVPVFIISSFLFVHYLKVTLYENKDVQKSIVLAGIVFAFGSYTLMLSMHLIDPMRHANDLRFILGLISLLSTGVIATGLAYSSNEAKKESSILRPTQPGYAQWDNFTLSNTPEEMKKGVTDISKYYGSLQKTAN